MIGMKFSGFTSLLCCVVLVCPAHGLPSPESYSSVRVQKGTVQGLPVVGSDMPAILLSNPSLGDQQSATESPFERKYDGLKSTPQNDLIVMGSHKRKRSVRIKMLDQTIERNERPSNTDLVISSDKSDDNLAAGTSTDAEDMERSNSFGIGFFNGGNSANPWGGGNTACCGYTGWSNGGWGSAGWGSTGWGGWGGNGWGSGGWGNGCCGGYYG